MSQIQAFTIAVSAAGPSVSITMTSVPVAGNILVVNAGTQIGGGAGTMSDNMTDGGTWNTGQGPIAFAATTNYYQYWKQVGSGANSNKVITFTEASSGFAIIEDCAEFNSTIGNTWAVDGTPVNATATSTNANGGNITLAGTGLLVAHFTGNAGAPTAGTGGGGNAYTRDYQNAAGLFRESTEWTTNAAGTYSTDWVSALQTWLVMGIGFKCTTSSTFNAGWSTGATKMIGGVH